MDKLSRQQNMPAGDKKEINQEDRIIADFDERDHMAEENKNTKIISGALYIGLIILGIATGFLLAKSGPSATDKNKNNASSVVISDNVVGSKDTKTFKDSAEGVIEKGGLDGEGTHKLIREGGPSQTAYLTSSVVDLDEFIGKTVKVWGQTMAAKKAAWLMDVGMVEIK